MSPSNPGASEEMLNSPSVNDALRIMDIEIRRSTSSRLHVRGIRDVEEDKSAIARHVLSNTSSDITTDRSNSQSIAELLIDHNVMSTAHWKLVPRLRRIALRSDTPMTSKIILSESRWVRWIEGKEFGQIEQLNAVTPSLRSDDQQAFDNTDLSPSCSESIPRRETTQVEHLSFRADLHERSTVELTYSDKFPSTR